MEERECTMRHDRLTRYRENYTSKNKNSYLKSIHDEVGSSIVSHLRMAAVKREFAERRSWFHIELL